MHTQTKYHPLNNKIINDNFMTSQITREPKHIRPSTHSSYSK